MALPEIAGSVGDLTVRCWRPDDAPALRDAIAHSREHLAPWMEFANEPNRPAAALLTQFDAWQQRRRDGADGFYGMFLADQVVGGCGLHRRIGPAGLEIGYWVHVDYTRRGFASTAAALLTSTAFAFAQITHVEIHHDAANAASEAVPRKLGFTLIGESPTTSRASGEIGVERRWQMTRADWRALPLNLSGA